MTPLETFLRDVQQTHATGGARPETPYHPAIQRLLDDVGRTLSPGMRCFIHTSGTPEAGIPDGGLYTADQFQKTASAPLAGQPPGRGALEVKGPKDAAGVVALSPQVEKYLAAFGQVLVTTLRVKTLLLGIVTDTVTPGAPTFDARSTAPLIEKVCGSVMSSCVVVPITAVT